MTTEGDRQSVLRQTKVRTALKGDSSWIQRRRAAEQEEEEEEKPWLVEVRASRVNGAFTEPAPEPTPAQPEPNGTTSTDSTKTSGYLIRGVFTKTDTKPPSSTNGYIGTAGFNKRPSEGYKKIAPHTVRLSSENSTAEPEPSISAEEQERRTEAASNVLRNSSARQRSYVLSAAKKYESPSETPDSSDPPVKSFVAKRVIISDDEEKSEPKAADAPAPQAQLTPEQSLEMSVDEPAPPVAAVRKKAPSATPRAKAELTPKHSFDTLDALSDSLLSSTPVPTSVSKPAAEVSPAALETKPAPSSAPRTEPAPKPSAAEPVTPAVPATAPGTKPGEEPTPKPSVMEPLPASAAPVTPVAAETKTPAAVKPEAKSEPAPKPSVTEPAVPAVKTVPAAQKPPSAAPEPKQEPAPKPNVVEPVPAVPVVPVVPVAQKAPSTTPETKPKTEPTPTPKPSVVEPVPVVPAAPVAQKTPAPAPETKPKTEPTPTPKPSVTEPLPAAQKTTPAPEPKPTTQPTPKASVDPKPVEKTGVLNNDDLLGLTQSTPQEPVNPVPPTTDLLTGADSFLPKSEKTNKSLDLLAVDIIPINTKTDKLSTDNTSITTQTTQTIVQSKDPKSSTETVTITTTKTEIISKDSSQVQPEKTQKSLDLLAFDLIPINTEKEKLSNGETPNKIETTKTVEPPKKETKGSADPFDPIPIVSASTKSPVELFDPLLLDSENTQSDAPSFSVEDVTPGDIDLTSFSTETPDEDSDSGVSAAYTRSADNSSPWDRWTSPIVNITTEEREKKTDPQPMETTSYTTYTRKVDRSVQEPKSQDSDSKKGIVYVKQYVDTPHYSSYNGSDVDYVTSTSSSYAYSSPPSTNSSACTYCGRPVGNDARITIEHLNISCHPECFQCGICSKPMGDFLDNMFLHRGTVHCENCYANVL
ncbi:zinc finger protein 185 isoform X12 [Astyanax mexicanus]|uniref:zinc finger protein 185 isoform X12 n=1 Tax=Astyanax mexicanus TaxID=7994 RepID=UPI0020CAC5F0|nr:zinc finger protein 185 isoform X12 [Astyanax mexicanus]